MGYMRHHAIIVTGDQEEIKKIANKITSIIDTIENECLYVSLPIPSSMNNYSSILIAPDGSKEGWEHSDYGDKARNEIINYLDTLRYSDYSTSYKYVEVQYGDDERENKVLRHSEDDRFSIG